MRNLKRKKYNAHLWLLFISLVSLHQPWQNQELTQKIKELAKCYYSNQIWPKLLEAWELKLEHHLFFFFNFVLPHAELEVFEQLSEIPSCLFCSGCMNTKPAYAEHTDQLSNINIQSDLFQMWINCLYAAKLTHACTIKISLKFPRTTKFLGRL